MDDKPTKCSMCFDEAVAIYYLARGCIAWPDQTLQALCAHHEKRSQPLGGMELLKDLRVGLVVQPVEPAPDAR
jgi:hypothetical protein